MAAPVLAFAAPAIITAIALFADTTVGEAHGV